MSIFINTFNRTTNVLLNTVRRPLIGQTRIGRLAASTLLSVPHTQIRCLSEAGTKTAWHVKKPSSSTIKQVALHTATAGVVLGVAYALTKKEKKSGEKTSIDTAPFSDKVKENAKALEEKFIKYEFAENALPYLKGALNLVDDNTLFCLLYSEKARDILALCCACHPHEFTFSLYERIKSECEYNITADHKIPIVALVRDIVIYMSEKMEKEKFHFFKKWLNLFPKKYDDLLALELSKAGFLKSLCLDTKFDALKKSDEHPYRDIFELCLVSGQSDLVIELFRQHLNQGLLLPKDFSSTLCSAIGLSSIEDKDREEFLKKFVGCFDSNEKLAAYAKKNGDLPFAYLVALGKKLGPSFPENSWQTKLLHKMSNPSYERSNALAWGLYLNIPILKLRQVDSNLLFGFKFFNWTEFFSELDNPLECKRAFRKLLPMIMESKGIDQTVYGSLIAISKRKEEVSDKLSRVLLTELIDKVNVVCASNDFVNILKARFAQSNVKISESEMEGLKIGDSLIRVNDLHNEISRLDAAKIFLYSARIQNSQKLLMRICTFFGVTTEAQYGYNLSTHQRVSFLNLLLKEMTPNELAGVVDSMAEDPMVLEAVGKASLVHLKEPSQGFDMLKEAIKKSPNHHKIDEAIKSFGTH